MPIYEYRCLFCGNKFEKVVEYKNRIYPCPKCGGETKRLISTGVIDQYKGSGFYTTDYKGK